VTYTIPASGGCAAVPVTTSVTITAVPTASISYGGTPFCQSLVGAQSVTLTGTGAYTGGTYSSTTGLSIISGTGVITPGTSTAGTYTVTYTIPASGGCAAVPVTTSVTIIAPPTAEAGDDASICQGTSHTVSGANVTNQSDYRWSTNGTGNLTNATTLTPTYTPGPTELGSVTLTLTAYAIATCSSNASDQMVINIQPQPIAVAGPNAPACVGILFNLNGSASNYSSVEWTTNGTGTLTNPNSLTTKYTPSAGDAIAEPRTFTLTVIGISPCATASDAFLLTVSANPTVYAGIDRTMCTGPNPVTGATATNYSVITWTSSGNGTFSNNHITNPIYTPGPTDLTTGSVILTLTASPIAPCTGDISDAVSYTVINLQANAGVSATICEGSNYNLTNATASPNDATLTWSSSGTGSFDNIHIPNPTYIPSASDIANGAIVLTLTAEYAPCTNISSSMTLTIHSNPVANAGSDPSICEGTSYTVNTASASHYASILWTGGTGTLQNPTTLNPTYTPTATEVALGSVVLTLTAYPQSPCAVNATDAMTIFLTPLPTTNAGLDATICEGNNHTISGSSASNYSVLNWSGGDGTFSNGNTLYPTYTPGTNDRLIGVVTLTMTATGQDACLSTTSTSQMLLHIIQDPIMYAGPDETICARSTFPVVSATEQHASTILWTTSGSGTFSDATALLPIYNPSESDIANGIVTLTITGTSASCLHEDFDKMLLHIIAGPQSNAGSDASICENATFSIITASASNYSSITWTSTGNGTFSNVNDLKPVYTPGTSDIAAGYANLTLTANSNAPCAETANDFMVLTFGRMPVVNAGSDVPICEGNTYTTNTATVQNSTSLTWTTSGSGSFSNANERVTTYTPDADDILNGFVDLTLTAGAIATCTGTVSDIIRVTITKTPTADAGPNMPICQGDYTISGATAAHYLSLLWTTSGTGIFNVNNTTTPTYTPSVADIAAGSVILTLTANPNVPCGTAATDDITLTIHPFPTAYAGANASICKDQAYYIGDANADHYSKLLWTTSGDGSVANQTSINPTYTPGAADITAGSVILTLQATGINPCNNTVTDQLTLTIQSTPLIDAGPVGSICQGNTFTTSGASVSNSATTTWTSSGTGSFTNPGQLTTTYTPSALDITNGGVTLMLTATSKSPCSGTVSDTRVLTITPLATAYAGPNATICANTNFTVSGATATHTATVVWSTSGNGTFTGNGTLTPTYYPGSTDISLGFVTLTLTATPTAPCIENVSSTMLLTFDPIAEVDAGIDASVCEGGIYQLDATADHNANINWSSNGPGSFTNGNTINPTYTPDPGFSGSVILTATVTSILPCVATVEDHMYLTVTPLPVVYAGPTGTTCGANPFSITAATQSHATNVLWTTSGSGVFSNSSLLNPTYTPGAADILAGSVVLTLTGNPGTTCTASDAFTLIIVAPATAFAGDDAPVCENGSYTINDATATHYTAVNWTATGTGTLTGAGTLTPTYTVGLGETGSVILTLTATANTPCANVMDQITLTIVPKPLIDAGADANTCAGTNYSIVAATADHYLSLNWSTYGTGTFSNAAILHPIYTASLADIAAGHVHLTLTAQPNTPCSGAVSDAFMLSFIPAATANAGPAANICAGSTYTVAGASVSNNSAILWSTNGLGNFNFNNIIAPIYTPSDEDIAAGSVILTLTAVGNPPCTDASSIKTLTITPAPSANAGLGATICEGSSYTIGDATASHATLLWTSSGTGGTLLNETSIRPTYTPSASDIATGSVVLTLTASAIAPCLGQVTSSKTLLLKAAPHADAGPADVICEGSYVFAVGVATASNYSSLNWTSSGTGGWANQTTLTPTYTPSTADYSTGSVTLTLQANGNSPCNPATDAMVLTLISAPTADAGSNTEICEKGSYTVSDAIATHKASVFWTTTGLGNLTGDNTLTPTYIAAAGETGIVTLILTAYVNPPCAANATDQMTITIQPKPSANAGIDATICEGSTYTLSGTASYTASVSWSRNGSGTFDNPNILAPTYTPSAADILAGSVTLTLTGVAISPCAVNATDAMTLTLGAKPIVEAGLNATTCEDGGYLLSQSSVSHETSIAWTGGDGYFSNSGTLHPTYTPGVNDKFVGYVTLTLTAQPIAPCTLPVSDFMVLTINNLPIANTGADATACSLTYTVTGATAANYSTINWTKRGSGTFSNGNTTAPTYTPSSADWLAGSVTLVMNVTGISPCSGTVSDDMILTLPPLLTASAGSDANVCQDVPFTVNGATATNWVSLQWTTSGTGPFINTIGRLDPTYTPDATDIANGSVILTLHATGNPPCNSTIIDAMVLTIIKTSVANAGPNDIICAGSDFNITEATASNISTIVWSTTGTGTFLNDNIIKPTYIPSDVDIAAGSVNLTMTTHDISPCVGNDADVMTLTIKPNVTVNAGPDNGVCYPASFPITDATSSNSQSLSWTSSGNGTFIPSNTVFNPTYQPSSADLSAGSVVLTLTGTGVYPCNTSASDIMILRIDGAPGTAGPITGTTPVCIGQTWVYSIPILPSASGYDWSVPSGATITSGNNTNAITVSFGASAVSGNITVYATNACGSGSTASFSVQVNSPPPTPGIISGNQTICLGASGIAYSITPLTGVTGYIWTIPGGATIASGQNTAAITVDYGASAVSGDITVKGTNDCGNGPTASLTITVNPLPPTPTISAGGPTTFCEGGSVTLTASTPGYSYLWSPGSQLTQSIVVSASGNYSVVVADEYGCASAASDVINVTVNPLPGSAGNIIGSSVVCTSQTNVSYSVSPITDATGYNWALPTGASIVSGPNTNSITVNFSPTAVSGTITVQGTNDCGTGVSSTPYLVTVNNLPGAAGIITGTSTVCQGQTGATYFIVAIPNATGYYWTVPSGATIVSGTNTNTITVDYSATAISGNVTVQGTNNCGTGSVSTLAVTVNPLPSPAGAISGLATVCEGQKGVIFSVLPIANAKDYHWTLPTGATIDNGENTYAITVNFGIGASSGNVIVYGSNIWGNGLPSVPYPVIVNRLPNDAEVITGSSPVCQGQSGVVYSVQSIPGATGYIWTLSPGATLVAGVNTNSIMVDFSTIASDGIITVKGTNDCGNGIVSPNFPVKVNISPIAVFTFDPINQCVGVAVSFTDASLPNGGGIITSWLWDFGDPGSGANNTSTSQNPTHIFSSSGIHAVTLLSSNVNNCSGTISHDVNVNALPVAAFANSTPCFGTQTTFNDQSIAYAPAIISWDWDFGDGTPHSSVQNPSHNYAAAGTYNVTLIVTNSNGCVNSTIKPVQVVLPPTAEFMTSSGGCTGSPVQFTDQSSVSYGYITTLTWDFGDGNTTVINYPSSPNVQHVYATAGTYSAKVTLVTSNSCVASISHDVTVTSGPIADFSHSADLCLGQPVQFTDESSRNGSGPITMWQWNFDDPASGTNNTSYQPNPTHIFAAYGTHSVTLTITNSNSCQNTKTNTVEIFALPVADFSADTVCQRASTTFTDLSTANATAITWDWDFGDGSFHSVVKDPSHTYASGGTYTVKLTVTNSYGCSQSVIKPVQVVLPPTANFITSSLNCSGSPVQFTDQSTVSQGYINKWTWDFGDGTTPVSITYPGAPNVIHTYAAAGTYNATLIVETSSLCTSSISHVILVIEGPKAIFTSNNNLCVGDIMQFTDLSQANSGGSIIYWSWDFGDPISGTANISSLQNPVHAFTSAGTFHVRLIIVNTGSCRDTTYKDLTINEKPVAGFAADTACFGSITHFTDKSTPLATITSRDWDFGDGTPHSQVQNTQHLYVTPGVYTVTLFIKNLNGCTSFISKQVKVNEAPVAAFSYINSNCAGAPIVFNDLSFTKQGHIVKWFWNFGDGSDTTINFPGNQNVNHNYANDGNYHVNLTITTDDSCTNIAAHDVSIGAKPLANFDFDAALCQASPVNFRDLSQPNGGGPIINWNWDFGDPTSGVNNFSTIQNPSHIYQSGGNYQVRLLIGNINNCSDTMTRPVSVNNKPNAHFTVNTICKGDSTQFHDISVANSETIISRLWNFGDGTTSTAHDPKHLYSAAGSYTVTLNVINSLNCQDDTVGQVLIYAGSTAMFTYTDACMMSATKFTDQSTTLNGVINRWSWDFGDPTSDTSKISSLQNPTHAFANGGMYQVTLTVLNSQGCTAHITLPVAILKRPTASFSAFSTYCPTGRVSFSDHSTTSNAPIVSWYWTFEPGYNSTEANPTYNYAKTDTAYAVKLIVTDLNGCSDNIVDTVFVVSGSKFAFTATTPCIGDQTLFSALNLAANDTLHDLRWDFGETSSGFYNYSTLYSPSHTYQSPGTYIVKLRALNSNNCVDSVYQQVIVNPLPISDFSYMIPYCDSIVTFYHLASGNGVSIDSLIWVFGDGDTIVKKAVQDTVQHLFHGFGIYNVSLTVINANGCRNTITKPVEIACIEAVFSKRDTLECSNLPVYLIDSSSPRTLIKRWYWDFGDGSDTTYTTFKTSLIQHRYPNPGDYLVTLVVSTSSTGTTLSDTARHWIKVNIGPTAKFSVSDVCDGVTAKFINLSTSNGADIISNYWTFGDSIYDTIPNPQHRYANSGDYQSMLVVTNKIGCRDTMTNPVIVFAIPTADISIENLCIGHPTKFIDNSTLGSATINHWNWSITGESGIWIVDTIQNPELIFDKIVNNYTAQLIVSDTNGCIDTTSKSFTELLSPKSDFSYIEHIEGTEWQIIITNNSLNADLYEWDFGNGTYSKAENPTATFTSEGDYPLRLISINSNTCTDTLYKTYHLLFKGLYIPTAFAPEDPKGLVNVFQPKGEGLETFNIEVFDSWGTMIWSSTTAELIDGQPGPGWDGKYRGEFVAMGTYVWRASAVFKDGTIWNGVSLGNNKDLPNSVFGIVTLIR